jgi:serine/threonine-protein kinase
VTPPLRIARYDIERGVGDGGFGAVYLARDPTVNRRVAIRLLHADLSSAVRRESFHLEARAAAALRHRNIAAIYDFGEFEGHPYLVLEYVEGRTLAAVAATPGPRAIARTLLWLEQLCAGLDWAHRAGVLHRNIKPANLVVDDVDRLKILDFGVAAMAAGRATRGSESTGTVGYLPPEYVQGAAADRLTDIFSVGAVAYLMLTRREPFPGETPKTVTQRVVACAPAPPRDPATGRDLDRQLTDIVMRALHKSADRRYQDAGELQRAFSEVRDRFEREPGAATAPSRAIRSPVDPDAEKRRRDEMILVALERARSDLAAGRLEQAMAGCIEAATLDADRSETIDLTERVRRALDLRDAAARSAGAKSSESPRPLDTAEMEALFAKTPPPGARGVQGTDQPPRRPTTAAARELEQHLAEAEAAVSDGDWVRALSAVENAIRLDPMHPRAYELQTEIEEARARPPATQTGGEPTRPTATRSPDASARQTAPPVPPSRATPVPALGPSPGPVAAVPPAPAPSPAAMPLAATAPPATTRPATEPSATARPATEPSATARPATARPGEPATAPIRQAAPPPAPRRDAPAQPPAAAAYVAPKPPRRARKPAMGGSSLRRAAMIALAVAVLAGVVSFSVWKPPPPPPQTVKEVLRPDRPIEVPPPPPPAPPPVADPEPAAPPAPIVSRRATSGGPTANVKGRGDQPVRTSTTVGGRVATPPEPAPTPPPPPVPPPAPPSAPPQRVARARSLIDAGSVREAVDLAVELRRDFPEDKEVLVLLDQAQAALRGAIRQALDTAASSENAGNWPAALQQLERAQQLDPAVGGLEPTIMRVKAKMNEAGNTAFVDARQLDALDRVADAIKSYEAASRNLPDGDPRKRIAVERLAVLRARK